MPNRVLHSGISRLCTGHAEPKSEGIVYSLLFLHYELRRSHGTWQVSTWQPKCNLGKECTNGRALGSVVKHTYSWFEAEINNFYFRFVIRKCFRSIFVGNSLIHRIAKRSFSRKAKNLLIKMPLSEINSAIILNIG